MLLDDKQRPWIRGTIALVIVSTGLYLWYYWTEPDGPRGGSVPGLLFGIAGSMLMLFCGCLGLRKKLPKWRIGSAQWWLRAHIWLGLLSVLWIGFHAGFRLGGTIEILLWVVLGGIVISGFVGLGLQQVLPRYLTSRISLETFYGQVNHICDLLQFEADADVASWCGPLEVKERPEAATDDRLATCKLQGITPPIAIYRSQVTPLSDPPMERPTVGGQMPVIPADWLASGVGAIMSSAAVTPAPAASPAAINLASAKMAEVREPAEAPSLISPMPAPDPEPPPAPVEAPPAMAPYVPSIRDTAILVMTRTMGPMSPTEKLAAMRAAKRVEAAIDQQSAEAENAPASHGPAVLVTKSNTMSTAEKLAIMQARSRTSKPSITETPRSDVPAVAAKPAATRPEALAPKSSPSEPASPAAEIKPAADQPAGPMNAADKIALMRAKMAAKNNPGAAAPATAAPTSAPAAPQAKAPTVAETPVAEASPAAPLNAADKIALMRAKMAAKNNPGAVTPTPVPASKPEPAAEVAPPVVEAKGAEASPAAPLNAADKIALMRAKMAAKNNPGAAAPAPTPAPAPKPEPVAEVAPPVVEAKAAEASPAAPLNAADKIALMRAKMAAKNNPGAAAPPATPAPAPKPVPAAEVAPPVVEAKAAESSPAAPLNAADKIALMRAKMAAKNNPGAAAPAATPAPAPKPEPVAEVAPPAVEAKAADASPAAPLNAADKIAMMRAKMAAKNNPGAAAPAKASSNGDDAPAENKAAPEPVAVAAEAQPSSVVVGEGVPAVIEDDEDTVVEKVSPVKAASPEQYVPMSPISETIALPTNNSGKPMTMAERIRAMREEAERKSRAIGGAMPTGPATVAAPVPPPSKAAPLSKAATSPTVKPPIKSPPPASAAPPAKSSAPPASAAPPAKSAAPPSSPAPASKPVPPSKPSPAAIAAAAAKPAAAKPAAAPKADAAAKPAPAAKGAAAGKAAPGAEAAPGGKPEPKAAKPKKGPQPLKPVAGSEPLLKFYMDEVRPFLSISRSPGKLSNTLRSRGKFSEIRSRIPPPLHETLDCLEEACAERRQLRQQVRIHHWMHNWMLVHLPLSWALLVLGLWHAIVSVYY